MSTNSITLGGSGLISGFSTITTDPSYLTDDDLLNEVKKRKLIHPDIVDGWQKARKITQLEETIAKAQKELEALKNGCE